MDTGRRKLFLIINRLSHAGGSMDALSMAIHLTQKYEITVLYGEKENDEKDAPLILLHPAILFLKINSLHRSILPINDILSFRKIYKLIKQHRPDIVHTIGFKTGLLGRLAAKVSKVPVIVHTFHGHVFHSYYNKTISRFICVVEQSLARISDFVIAISPQQAYELSRIHKIAPEHKIKTIFIGIDRTHYNFSADKFKELRKQYRVPKTAIVVAIIGRLVSIKNHTLFFKIAKRILQKRNDVFFFIIGEGKNKNSLQKSLLNEGLEWSTNEKQDRNARFIFTSWISNIAFVMQEIDIVVSTSANEGTPVSLIEAQLFEKPVVATNVGGVRDTLVDGETGFLVDDFNIDEFVQKLHLLIDNRDMRMAMGNKGKAFVTERFSKEKEVALIDALYADCLRSKNIVGR